MLLSETPGSTWRVEMWNTVGIADVIEILVAMPEDSQVDGG